MCMCTSVNRGGGRGNHRDRCPAAAAGGFTAVCAMPNTDPVTDNQAAVGFIVRQAIVRAGCPRVSDRRDLA